MKGRTSLFLVLPTAEPGGGDSSGYGRTGVSVMVVVGGEVEFSVKKNNNLPLQVDEPQEADTA